MLIKNKNDFKGIYAATICPMHSDGRINEEGIAAHFTELMGCEGIIGLLINGHAGENHILNRDEKLRVVEIARNTIGKHGIIVCGVNCESSLEAQYHTEDALVSGADAIMVFPPYSWTLSVSTKMAVLHHEQISKVCNIPMFLFQASIGSGLMAYNHETLRELIQLPSVIAVKEGSWESSHYEENRRLIKKINPDISVMASGDEHLMACFVLGSEGSLVSLASVIPQEIVGLDKAVKSSDLKSAKYYHQIIYPLAKAIYGTKPAGFATARIKTCLKLMGRLEDASLRRPGHTLEKSEISRLETLLNELNIIQ
jgi:4-hydroxy-tetrahydrodipicolinate synthase